jgi:hypothetical protein
VPALELVALVEVLACSTEAGDEQVWYWRVRCCAWLPKTQEAVW